MVYELVFFFLLCSERLSNYGKYLLVLDRLLVRSIISILLNSKGDGGDEEKGNVFGNHREIRV